MTKLTSAFATTIFFAISGCAVPEFDIPTDNPKAPSVNTIVQRIDCELIALIKDDNTFRDGENYMHRNSLLLGHYRVNVVLFLTVANTGEIAPSFNFPTTSNFTFNLDAKLAQKRTHTFSQNLSFSIDELNARWKENDNAGQCPKTQRNLAGELGLERIVTIGLTTKNSVLGKDNTDFGGSIEFQVTRSLNKIGPTWTLTHFKGPGSFGKLENVSTNKISVAFVETDGTKAAQPQATSRAKEVLDRLLLEQLSFD